MGVDFIRKNLERWLTVLQGLFPEGVPAIETWESPEEIQRVLQSLGKNLVHLFYPSSGGNDLMGAVWDPNAGVLLIQDGEFSFTEVRPSRLTFRSVHGKGLDWAYFHLIASEFSSSGADPFLRMKDLGSTGEEYFLLQDGELYNRSQWDEGGEECSGGVHIRRFGSSAFVMWAKGSPYNQEDPDMAYNAPQSEVSEEDYHRIIMGLAMAY